MIFWGFNEDGFGVIFVDWFKVWKCSFFGVVCVFFILLVSGVFIMFIIVVFGFKELMLYIVFVFCGRVGLWCILVMWFLYLFNVGLMIVWIEFL